MKRTLSKRALQCAVALGGIVPVSAGLAGILFGPGMVDGGEYGTAIDSHYRYLSGLLLGVGLMFWSTIPHIEHRSTLFRSLALIVVFGGIGRAASIVSMGAPNNIMLSALAMELLVTPLLALWQYRLAKAMHATR